MKKFYRFTWVVPALMLVALVALVACGGAGVPANVAPTVVAAQQTVAAAVTNIAPTLQAAAPTIAAAATQASQGIATAQAAVATAVPAAATPAAASAKDTIVWAANIDDIVSFDPAEAYEFSDILGVHAIYDTLVKFDGTDLSTLKPGLADSWDVKTVGDSQVLTFHLKDGVKFASGNPFTADDVVYSIQRIIALNKPPAFLMTDVGKLTKDSVKAVDPKTVTFTFPKDVSVPAFLTVLTGPTGGIVDSKETMAHEANGDFGNTYLKDHSAGSGPYMLDHWTKDVEFLLKANPNAAIQPKTPNFLAKHIEDGAVQQAELQKGDVDIAQNLTPEQIAALKGQSGVSSLKADSLLVYYLGMNVNMKPLDKPEVREALRTAIDYDGIVNDLLSGNVKKLQTIIPNGLFGANPDTPFQKDTKAAKDLLAKAGVPDGFEMDLLVPTGNGPGGVSWGDLAAKIQADWADIGVKVNIKQQAQADILTSYRAQKAPIVLLLWGPDFPDPDANGTPFAVAPLGKRNNFVDPKAADLASKAALETDSTKRAADYKDLTEYMLHNGPFGILFQPSQLFGTNANLKGFVWNPAGYSPLWEVSK